MSANSIERKVPCGWRRLPRKPPARTNRRTSRCWNWIFRKTEAECAAAGAELDALMKAHEQDRNAVTETSIRKAKAVLAEKQVELERAQTMLEFQLQPAKSLSSCIVGRNKLAQFRHGVIHLSTYGHSGVVFRLCRNSASLFRPTDLFRPAGSIRVADCPRKTHSWRWHC